MFNTFEADASCSLPAVAAVDIYSSRLQAGPVLYAIEKPPLIELQCRRRNEVQTAQSIRHAAQISIR